MRRCLRRCETFSETVPSHHRLIAGPLEMMIGTSLIPFVFSLGCYDRLITQFQVSRSKTYIICNPLCAVISFSDSYSIRIEPCCTNYCLTVEAQIIVSHGQHKILSHMNGTNYRLKITAQITVSNQCHKQLSHLSYINCCLTMVTQISSYTVGGEKLLLHAEGINYRLISVVQVVVPNQ